MLRASLAIRPGASAGGNRSGFGSRFISPSQPLQEIKPHGDAALRIDALNLSSGLVGDEASPFVPVHFSHVGIGKGKRHAPQLGCHGGLAVAGRQVANGLGRVEALEGFVRASEMLKTAWVVRRVQNLVNKALRVSPCERDALAGFACPYLDGHARKYRPFWPNVNARWEIACKMTRSLFRTAQDCLGGRA